MIPKPSIERDADVQAIKSALSAVSVGHTITFDALSASLGRNVRRCMHLFYKAAKQLNQEAGAVFVNVRDVGYRRQETSQIPAVGTATREHIRRSARKAQKTIINAAQRANDLSPEHQRKISAELSSLGLIEHIGANKFVARLEGTGRTAPTPTAEVCREFMRQIGAVANGEG